MGDLAPVLAIWGVILGSAWTVWVVSSNARRRKVAEVQKDMQVRLLEKFGTSDELLSYLNTDAGRNFVESATIEQARPMGRIMRSIQTGLNLLLVGAGLLFLHGRLPASWTDDTLVFGVLAVALGVGFLLSAGVSYWLSKNWGLFEQESKSHR
jgi:hypothetical protein